VEEIFDAFVEDAVRRGVPPAEAAEHFRQATGELENPALPQFGLRAGPSDWRIPPPEAIPMIMGWTKSRPCPKRIRRKVIS
jgi:hypothetical protein